MPNKYIYIKNFIKLYVNRGLLVLQVKYKYILQHFSFILKITAHIIQ